LALEEVKRANQEGAWRKRGGRNTKVTLEKKINRGRKGKNSETAGKMEDV
jgi:hypothetical protein